MDKVYSKLVSGDETPIFGEIPQRTGYTFIGWSPDVSKTVTDNTVYVAQWKKNSVTVSAETQPLSPNSTAEKTLKTGYESNIKILLTLTVVAAAGITCTVICLKIKKQTNK